MRGKLWFLGGLAAGFVLGARAGREKYEQIVQKARQMKDHPTVQEAAGVVQEQASRLVSEGKDKLSQTKVGERLLSSGSESGTVPTGTTPTGTTTSTSSIGSPLSSTDSTLAGSSTRSTRSNSASSGTTDV